MIADIVVTGESKNEERSIIESKDKSYQNLLI